MSAILEILAPGTGISMQDTGRSGWKRFGVPPGGAMDQAAAIWANKLVGNKSDMPVLEILLSGARLRLLEPCVIAITGAEVDTGFPRWRSLSLAAGTEVLFGPCHAGVWSYLAMLGGFAAERWLGSSSVNPRAGLGASLKSGDRLHRASFPSGQSSIAARFLPPQEYPALTMSPEIAVWPGPDERMFSESALKQFYDSPWTISAQSDRSGYRLEGSALPASDRPMLSSPVVVGTVQIPPGGHPIVILRDGPTVGGYPRLAVLDPAAISRFAQCAPGENIRFRRKDG